MIYLPSFKSGKARDVVNTGWFRNKDNGYGKSEAVLWKRSEGSPESGNVLNHG
jgi:hypothetical protein